MTVKCMGRVVRVYKQALFRNHGLLSSIPQFTLERSWPTMRINSRVNFRKTPEIPTLCAARVCPSTPHSVTSNQGGTSVVQVLQWWIRMDCRAENGSTMCTGQTWIVVATLAPHILVAPGLIELQAFDDHTFQSNIYMDCANPHTYKTYIDCVASF